MSVAPSLILFVQSIILRYAASRLTASTSWLVLLCTSIQTSSYLIGLCFLLFVCAIYLSLSLPHTLIQLLPLSLSHQSYQWLKEKIVSEDGRKQQAKLKELNHIAEKLGCTLPQLAVGKISPSHNKHSGSSLKQGFGNVTAQGYQTGTFLFQDVTKCTSSFTQCLCLLITCLVGLDFPSRFPPTHTHSHTDF